MAIVGKIPFKTSVCGTVAAIFLVTGSLAEEAKLSASSQVRLERLTANFLKPYKYMLDGNKKDLTENRKRAEYYKKKAAKSKSKKSQSAKTARRLGELYEELTALNDSIVTSFENRSATKARESCEKIPGVESRIQAVTKKPVKRTWLTFKEMEGYLKAGYKYKTEDPILLPLAKANWKLKKKPTKKSVSKAKSAKNQGKKSKATGSKKK